jgi:hypothetical protein
MEDRTLKACRKIDKVIANKEVVYEMRFTEDGFILVPRLASRESVSQTSVHQNR